MGSGTAIGESPSTLPTHLGMAGPGPSTAEARTHHLTSSPILKAVDEEDDLYDDFEYDSMVSELPAEVFDAETYQDHEALTGKGKARSVT